jgi:hypothetical protein
VRIVDPNRGGGGDHPRIRRWSDHDISPTRPLRRTMCCLGSRPARGRAAGLAECEAVPASWMGFSRMRFDALASRPVGCNSGGAGRTCVAV